MNYCSDIDLSKIDLKCNDNEIVSIQESAPIQSHFFDALIYRMQIVARKGIVRSMGVDYGLYNPSIQVEIKVNQNK